ncbi:hypothetical protein J2T08_004824 [Neorhizobium galegae]|nr:hypothetical protein [Neorhizobium galegae]
MTAGSTLDDARAMAEEALAFHVEGIFEDGEAIPEPSLENVMADPANLDGLAILVTLKTGAAKLPEDMPERIDRFATDQGLSRSGFLTRAARHEIERDAGWDLPRPAGRKRHSPVGAAVFGGEP